MRTAFSRRRHLAATTALLGAAGALVAGQLAASSATAAAPVRPAASRLPAVVPASAGHIDLSHVFSQPPTTSQCEAQIGIACYGPLQYEKAYNVKALFNQGITGRGETIAIVDSFGSPTIQADLHRFDSDYGLPDPNLSIIQPSGAVPPYDPTNSTMIGWAQETSLDVEYAHAMAPGANILLVETPVAETEGSTGLPEMMDAEKYVVDHHLAGVISQSFGATEETFSSPQAILRLRYAFEAAQRAGVTVLASSGDNGATSQTLSGTSLYPYRVNSWPSSDPLVTSVGGTQLHLDDAGNRIAPDEVWNDGYGAGGGGLSHVFSRPAYQDVVRNIVHTQRGTPDISMSAAVNGGALVYLGMPGVTPGYYIIGGTSEASPLFSGVVSLTDQIAGHPIGQINPALYRLGSQGYGPSTGLVDVTIGNNNWAGVPGYPARPGYDLASGWGTVNGARFAVALARMLG